MAGADQFEHLFQGDELENILGIIEAKGTSATNDNDSLAMDFFTETPIPLGLQFQPHLEGGNDGSMSSTVSSYTNNLALASVFGEQSAADQQMQVAQLMNGVSPCAPDASMLSVSNGLPPMTGQLCASHPMLPGQCGQVLPNSMYLNGAHMFGMASGTLPPSVPQTSSRGKQVEKPMVSHSTVEKQRRDRINSLIDELRELVPPQKNTACKAEPAGPTSGAGAEARRPKHVVLADTIALLKHLQIQGKVPQGPNSGSCLDDIKAQIKEEPSNSDPNSKGSVSSQDDVDIRDEARTNPAASGAPQLPYIPMQPTQMAGVMVEKGPDCMYVQVKCRDRRGLLSDIINALKMLPLEVRTASVTTTPDGHVRDMFEVKVDDPAMPPEDIQNMVHDALFQPYVLEDHLHKRLRC